MRGRRGAFRHSVAVEMKLAPVRLNQVLGSFQDADDALQEALLKAWRGLDRFGGRSSFYTWLFRITTNTCLDAISRRPKRHLPVHHGPLAGGQPGDPPEPVGEPIWIEPYPDEIAGTGEGLASPEASYEQREAVELAFIAALQRLPARQRAVLILREVLGFTAKETAETLDASVASVNGLLRRARGSLEADLPERSQQESLRAIGDARVREIVARFTARPAIAASGVQVGGQ
jgi:RNA polymerase sigma-70 factor, ECF subfamily